MKQFCLLLAAGAVCLCVGCHSAPQQPQSAALKLLHTDRMTRHTIDMSPLGIDHDGSLRASGIWIPQPDTAANRLVFPEQVTILCDKGDSNCLEMRAEFVTVGDLISINGPDETYWPIKSWDKNSLFAEYGPWPHSAEETDKCQKHILSILFASGTVTTSDIPDHVEGCDAFKDTHVYRLVSGYYKINTSPDYRAASDAAAGK